MADCSPLPHRADRPHRFRSDTAVLGSAGSRFLGSAIRPHAMNDLDAQKRREDREAADTENEVRATMEQTREVLEASGAEIERAKRLLRETESLVDLTVSSLPEDASETPAEAEPRATR